MKKLSSWLVNRWNSYKYRFVPWIVWNLNESTAVSITEHSDVNNICKHELLSNLRLWCEGLEQYASLREDLDLYDRLHIVNQARLLDIAGFSLTRGESRIPGAGTGVFIRRGALNKGIKAGVYIVHFGHYPPPPLHSIHAAGRVIFFIFFSPSSLHHHSILYNNYP